MSTIEIKNLRQKYTAGAVGVYNYSISCTEGEHICILASKQGGKTSLLKCIAGLLPAEEGEILINNIPIQGKKTKERDIGIIFQDCGIIEARSVKWNLAYPLKIRKVPKEQIALAIAKIAPQCKLDHLLSFSAARLKSSDKIRLAFARALVRNTPLLLIDNPFALLKGEERRELFIELLPIVKAYKSNIFFATDSVDEAFTLNSRISVLHYGILEQTGTAAEIKESPATVQVYKYAYGLSANFAQVMLQKEDNKLFIELLGQKIVLDKRQLLNDIYIGANVIAGFMAKESTEGTIAKIEFCEHKEGQIYAHLICNNQNIIAPIDNFAKGELFIKVLPESIRLYDDSNEKLIY